MPMRMKYVIRLEPNVGKLRRDIVPNSSNLVGHLKSSHERVGQ
jgi:hypothetical protein